MPDVHSVLMLAGSWSPMLLIAFRYEAVALILSMIVATLAIIDYCLKIHWKLKQTKEKKRRMYSLSEDEVAWLEEKRKMKGY